MKCKCGCGQEVIVDYHKKDFKGYITGHNGHIGEKLGWGRTVKCRDKVAEAVRRRWGNFTGVSKKERYNKIYETGNYAHTDKLW